MKFSDWLDAEPGRALFLASHFGVSKSAVSQWKTSGVPRGRMLEVNRLSVGAVSLEEMLAVQQTPATEHEA